MKRSIDEVKKVWKQVSGISWGAKRERELRHLCQRLFEVSDVSFLTENQQAKLIRHLKARGRRREERYGLGEKILFGGLTRRERELLRRENPHRALRNFLIRNLRSEGVSRILLSRVSGLGQTAIHYILKKRDANGV